MADLIDRQAAVDALDEASEHWNIAEPFHEGMKAGYKCAATLILSLPSAQPKPQWIPCSEKLPEDSDYKPFSYYADGAILFCTKDGKLGFGWYYESTKEWANEDDRSEDVIAWMPLPEPPEEVMEP